MGDGAAGGLWCHQQWSPSWPPSWILPKWWLLCFTLKTTHKKALCIILAKRFAFIVKRSWKNMYFHPKMAWQPATNDVISCNHSNWPSLNLSQNVARDEREVLKVYPLEKNSQKPFRGGIHQPPPTPPPPSSCTSHLKAVTSPIKLGTWKSTIELGNDSSVQFLLKNTGRHSMIRTAFFIFL